MKASKISTCLYLILLTCMGCSAKGGKPSGCETSGVVFEDTPAQLTCIFDNQINRAGKTFMVYRKASEKSDAEIVALCEWEDEEVECHDLNGFKFKSEESNGRVTFEAKSAKEYHSGKYVCKTLPAAEARATECSLTVQKNGVIADDIIGCQTSPASLGEQASVSCTFPESVGMSGIIIEKFNDNNGRQKEEIARCEKSGGCIVKEGYENDYKTPTEIKINIPHVSAEQAGIYVCRSPLKLPGATAICTLPLSKDESNAETSRPLEQLLVPMYAILGCFVLLLITAAILGCTYLRHPSPSPTVTEGSDQSKDEDGKKGSPEPLLCLTRHPKG